MVRADFNRHYRAFKIATQQGAAVRTPRLSTSKDFTVYSEGEGKALLSIDTRMEKKLARIIATDPCHTRQAELKALLKNVTSMGLKGVDALVLGKVIGDVVDPFTPTLDVKVKYETKTVTNGAELKPSMAKEAPIVELSGNYATGELFTLVMVDPDAPSPSEPSYREWLHWVVIDIPATGAAPVDGMQVVEYTGPAPPIGIHRYAFIVFKQRGPLKMPGLPSRANFNTRQFANMLDLGLPVAAVYFHSQKEGASRRKR